MPPRPRILVADDHQAIVDRVGDELAENFDVVGTALNGRAALDAAIALTPDAVVMDISMPVMSGLEAAMSLSALPNPPRIVFLTVHEDAEVILQARRAGAAGYVLKRNLCTHLVPALRRALKR